MKKVFIIITALLCVFINTSSLASSVLPEIDRGFQKVFISCKTIDDTVINKGGHRTPPVAPEVYLDTEHSLLLFGMPCFESTILLVIPGTDNSVYTYVIPDGDTEVQFPTSLSGEYELHIHRSNYCFNGIIEL